MIKFIIYGNIAIIIPLSPKGQRGSQIFFYFFECSTKCIEFETFFDSTTPKQGNSTPSNSTVCG